MVRASYDGFLNKYLENYLDTLDKMLLPYPQIVVLTLFFVGHTKITLKLIL